MQELIGLFGCPVDAQLVHIELITCIKRIFEVFFKLVHFPNLLRAVLCGDGFRLFLHGCHKFLFPFVRSSVVSDCVL